MREPERFMQAVHRRRVVCFYRATHAGDATDPLRLTESRGVPNYLLCLLKSKPPFVGNQWCGDSVSLSLRRRCCLAV